MRLVLGILIVVSFVLAIRHELRGKPVGLISADTGDGLVLQVRPPATHAAIAVTCRRGAEAVALHGYWFGPERVRGPYEDGVALGSYVTEGSSPPCEVIITGGEDPLSYCIGTGGGVSGDACDPPVRADPPAEPEPME